MHVTGVEKSFRLLLRRKLDPIWNIFRGGIFEFLLLCNFIALISENKLLWDT
jgi:hypothetical protein